MASRSAVPSSRVVKIPFSHSMRLKQITTPATKTKMARVKIPFSHSMRLKHVTGVNVLFLACDEDVKIPFSHSMRLKLRQCPPDQSI